MESESENSADPTVHKDDVIMDEAHEQAHERPRQDSDYHVQNEWGLSDSHTNRTHTPNSGNTHEQETNMSSAVPRLHPIMVVLHPPPDPTIYERIYPSQTVERILDEKEDEDGEIYYSVEFRDGYIEDVSCFTLLLLFHLFVSSSPVLPLSSCLPSP
ncbi:hypothetical protein F4774DRAFT_359768 [Daldinia eschscholtzii]|nr:hypothetical protein F4774DRAFT_359768 [Daldinia eschscholtzii]